MADSENIEDNMKSIFISYSRKDSLEVAEFRSTLKYRNFQILIDDEEISFNKPWKANIRNKINDSNGAILFLSNNALNPESPIRTLELPLIAERFSDSEDEFYFFPILLEDLDEELFGDYSFTPLGSKEPVNFLEYFQLYDLQSETTLKNLSIRKRKREYQILNADISNALEGGTKSPGRKRLQRARQRKSLLAGLAASILVLGTILFSNTETFAQVRYEVLKYAYDTFSAENSTQDNTALANVIASQISEIDNLESLGADDAFIEELAEVEEINLQLELQQDTSFFNSLVGNEDTTTTTTSTVAPALTTTTTSSSAQTTTTTTPVTTTTLANSSSDVTSPTFTQALTASNITTSEVDLNWSASDNTGISYYVLKEGSSEIYRGSNTTKELEGLVSGNNYTLTVYAYDAAGNSNTSSVSFTTLGSSTSTTTTSTTTTSTTTTSTTTTTVPPSYGTPTIYKVTVSGSTITAFYNDATTNTGLNIVGHGCNYSTIPDKASGGTSTQSPSNSCSLSFPIEYGTVSIKVKQSFEGQVSCGEGCYTDNWSDWSDTITVNLETGSISDSSVQLVYNIPDPGPGCYPETYPKNKQVNSSLLPFTESEVRQSLKDYGNSYGRMCGDELVNAYVNHWKAKTADNIKALYPSWSDSALNTYLNGSGSGYSWDTGWLGNWNSTPLTALTGPTLNSLSRQCPGYSAAGGCFLHGNSTISFNFSASSGTLDWGSNQRVYLNFTNQSTGSSCSFWIGSNVASGTLTSPNLGSWVSECRQVGSYQLSSIQVRAGSSNPAEITYNLGGGVSCDSNWTNYSDTLCPSSHSFGSNFSARWFYNVGFNGGLDYGGYLSCSIDSGTVTVSLQATQVSGGTGYWHVQRNINNGGWSDLVTSGTAINSGSSSGYNFNVSEGDTVQFRKMVSINPYYNQMSWDDSFIFNGVDDTYTFTEALCS